jgi:elongation factor 1-alpha
MALGKILCTTINMRNSFDKYHSKRMDHVRCTRHVISQQNQPMILSFNTDGKRKNLKNTASILSMSDIAVLVYDATRKIDTTRAYNNTMWDHLLMAFAFGIRNVVVAINKMDLISYSEEKYKQLIAQLLPLLKNYGWSSRRITFIPVSADINVIPTAEQHISWYRGPTLHEIITKIQVLPTRSKFCPFRFSIYDIHRIGGIGTIAVGRVESGTLPGCESLVHCHLANGTSCTKLCKSVEMQCEQLSAAFPGQYVGIRLYNTSKAELFRGSVIGSRNDKTEVCEYFVAKIIVTHTKGIKVGYTPVIDCHQAHIPCKIIEIRSIVDKKTGVVLVNNPKQVGCDESAIVCFKPQKTMIVERYVDYPGLGRFVMRDGNYITGMGVVKSVIKNINQVKHGIHRPFSFSDISFNKFR